jgi:hypothetical protein
MGSGFLMISQTSLGRHQPIHNLEKPMVQIAVSQLPPQRSHGSRLEVQWNTLFVFRLDSW